jgi:DNA-binding sugar fermentation-stimulating protein
MIDITTVDVKGSERITIIIPNSGEISVSYAKNRIVIIARVQSGDIKYEITLKIIPARSAILGDE